MTATATKPKLSPSELQSRNLRMYEAKLRGDTSREIGEREGLHHGQVDRILRGMNGRDGSKKWEHKKPLPLLAKEKSSKSIKKAAKPSRNGKPKDSSLSLIDAAVVVLQRHAIGPMHPKQIVEVAIEQKLWTPGSGKTPFATLWSGILAELKKGSRASRFRLAAKGKGMFGLTVRGKEWKPTATD